jgi:hypothetical protein
MFAAASYVQGTKDPHLIFAVKLSRVEATHATISLRQVCNDAQ